MVTPRVAAIKARYMAGQRHRRFTGIQAGQDPHKIYEAALHEYADDYGWEREFVCFHWSQIALARMKEARQPQDVAEDGAWHNIREALDQRGREPN